MRAIADQDEKGIAITDRNGRLVCANDAYCNWFGGAVTPPGLPVDARTNAVLADCGRSAWRDGEAAVTEFICNGLRITGTIHRIGRAGDHLLWRWQKHVEADPVLDAAQYINGAVDAVSMAVSTVMQTYVDNVKKDGKFTQEAQNEAKAQAIEIATNLITVDAQKAITNLYGDFSVWICNKIEEEVKIQK